MSHNYKTNHQDSEPLLIDSSTSSVTSPPIAKTNRYRVNRKLPGLNFRRRDSKGYQEKCGRIRLLIILCGFVCFLLYVTNLKPYQNLMIVKIPEDDANLKGPKVPPGYLVWSPNCKMLSLEPLAPDVMNLFKKEEYEPCSRKQPLTSIEQNFANDQVLVVYHDDVKSKYLASGHNQIECCYQEITRSGANNTADDKYSLSKCSSFEQTFELPTGIEFILVQCKSFHSKDVTRKKSKTVYSNAHAIVRRKQNMQNVFDSFKTLYPSEKPTAMSVLMLGIDSISRLNLIRSMPMTAQYLYDTGWFELKGYNKMDDNTFPNLMAILTGYNQTTAYELCDPKQVGHLNKCPFIWKDFQNSGYATAYGEDEAKIGTFNYHKFGFLDQPTVHYLRPFTLVAEKYLKIKYKSSLKFCLGFKNYADFIYEYALDFATAYKDNPSFGLFWTNTFSHNEISDPSSMDERIKYYIEELDNRGILNTSAVIFFSDHGIRFGPVRQLLTGYLEERLPFIFIWLPQWFKEKYPEIVQNLKINRNRLTTPYDLHMTLKHILELSERVEPLPTALSCPNCQSIFNEMPWNRSCTESAVEAHWCACSAYTNINPKSTVVIKAVKFVIDSINKELEKKARAPNSTKPLCARMYLKSITLARKSETFNPNTSNEYVNYLVLFEVMPSGAKFESTISSFKHGKKNFEITGSISRLNEYSNQSYCVNNDYLKKYCFCTKKKKTSSWLNIL